VQLTSIAGLSDQHNVRLRLSRNDNIMEVVSPLTFARSTQSGKRRFGSPIHDASVASEDFDMDDCSRYGFQATKRRKRYSSGGGGDSFAFQTREKWSHSPFVPASGSPHAHDAAGLSTSVKRSRTSHDDASAQKLRDLQRVVEQQAAEIQRLKCEQESALASASQFSSKHVKVEHENKILKRAVAIQHDRQNQMAGELQGARQFKAEAEDRIRRLEHMNLTLQYQMQAKSPSGDDFMGIGRRPPDVY